MGLGHGRILSPQGLSECPLSQWEALDPEAIQEELQNTYQLAGLLE